MSVMIQQIHTVFLTISILSIAAIANESTYSNDSIAAVHALEAWQQTNISERSDLNSNAFALIPLTTDDAHKANELLWNSHLETLREAYRNSWLEKQIRYKDYIMKFDYNTFGDKPVDGRSLYLSMHGGGNAPPELNDRQWKNQIGLYEPKEGIYLAPRAPTNSWNLWHLSHIDVMFDQIIQSAIVMEDVNPNRVYIMGYSAGGDGVYQLAPRMADRWAAAAMMAGHPNETVPLGLRNIGFTLHMGGNDAAYDRNQVAQAWKDKLAELHHNDPQGYIHDVQIHEGKGHWMDREDQVAVEWMAKISRDPNPKKVVWKQDDVTHSRFYWLEVDTENEKVGTLFTASIDKQTITIEEIDGIESIIINLNDELLDMDRTITVQYQDNVLFKGKIDRNISTIYKTLLDRGDPELVYSGSIEVTLFE